MGTEALRRILLAALLAAFLGRIASTYRVFNDTFDESGHIAGGLEWLERHSYQLQPEHPPAARVVEAALPYWFAGLRLGHASELWGGGPWGHGDVASYWRTLALARAGNLVFAAIVFFVVYRWSLLLYGVWSALAACLLLACSPALLGHAGLATTDLAAAATFALAAYLFWQWSREGGLRYGVAAGAAFGLAALAKFSNLVFLPPVALLFFFAARWESPERVRLRTIAAGAGCCCVVAAMVVWAGYRFEIGALAPAGHQFVSPFGMGGEGSLARKLVALIGPIPLPAHRFVQGLLVLASNNENAPPAYLLGHVLQRGSWLYFPVCVLVKTTLPMLLLAVLGIAAGGRKAIPLLIAAAVVLGLSLPARINIGVRHVLPMYPMLAMLGGATFTSRRRVVLIAASTLAVWHAGESIAAHPNYLVYFNEIARGHEEQFLVDSNLDWGQDLARLGDYLREHHIDSVQLRYFGRSDPAKFGIRARPLDAGSPEAGWVAVSVTNLILQPDLAFLRTRPPGARVGKSIWLWNSSAGP